MALSDYSPILRNNTTIDEEELYKKHSSLSKDKKYDEAAKIIDNNQNAINASLLNNWENKIYNLYQLPIDFKDPYMYKDSEPTESEMSSKTIWQQEY